MNAIPNQKKIILYKSSLYFSLLIFSSLLKQKSKVGSLRSVMFATESMIQKIEKNGVILLYIL